MSTSREFISVFIFLVIISIALLIVRAQTFLLFSYLLTSLFFYSYEYSQLGWRKIRPFLLSLLKREVPHHILYILWVLIFSQRLLLYFLPLTLNQCGKIVLILLIRRKKSKRQQFGLISELILLETLGELIILVESGVSLLLQPMNNIFKNLSFILLFEIKYATYWGTHCSVNRLHRFIERQVIYRKNAYQCYLLVYRLVNQFGYVCPNRKIAFY